MMRFAARGVLDAAFVVTIVPCIVMGGCASRGESVNPDRAAESSSGSGEPRPAQDQPTQEDGSKANRVTGDPEVRQVASRSVGRIIFLGGLQFDLSICGSSSTVLEVLIHYVADFEMQPRYRRIEDSLSVCVVTTKAELVETSLLTSDIIAGAGRWDRVRASFQLMVPVTESELQQIVVSLGDESRHVALTKASSTRSE